MRQRWSHAVVLTGSLCAQTHIPYVAACGGIGATAVIAALYELRSSARQPSERVRLLRWIGVSCALLALVWMPPLVDQLRNKPGNLSVLFHYFAKPPSEALGIREAIPLVLNRLDAWFIVAEQLVRPEGLGRFVAIPTPEPWRGGVGLVLWAGCAAVSVRGRNRSLLSLHAVVATGVAVAIVAISRVFGAAWPYLMYWVWSVGVLLLAACGATLGSAALRRLGEASGCARMRSQRGLPSRSSQHVPCATPSERPQSAQARDTGRDSSSARSCRPRSAPCMRPALGLGAVRCAMW
jgi:hypothetical protein